jgi:hypothetical protein
MLSQFRRFIVSGCTAAIILAGCGALRQAQDDMQPAIGAPGATTQTSTIATHADRRKSWMLPGAKSSDLLYVSTAGDVLVYTYPGGKQVGDLTGFQLALGLCSDSAGDVWIAESDAGGLVEYAHGGTEPKKTLGDSYGPNDCAIDPTTGNLAATNSAGPYHYEGSVSIYPGASGSPTIYDESFPSTITYDDAGDVFTVVIASMYSTEVYSLPKGASGFSLFPGPSKRKASGVLWDGKDLAIPTYNPTTHKFPVQRFEVSDGRGKRVGDRIFFNDWKEYGEYSHSFFWISGSTFIGQVGSNSIGFWKYPSGGNPTSTISLGSQQPQGITVSRATK